MRFDPITRLIMDMNDDRSALTPEQQEERRRQEADRPLRPDLVCVLAEALPYVEESEQFNKPSCRTLSKRIRDIVEKENRAALAAGRPIDDGCTPERFDEHTGPMD